MAKQQIEYLQYCTSQWRYFSWNGGIDILKKFKRQQNGTEEVSITDIRQKIIRINDEGKQVIAYRIYVEFKDALPLGQSGFQNVGWIIEYTVPNCMICYQPFSIFKRRKYHCHACGILICHVCSRVEASIQGFQDLGEMKVCSHCLRKKVLLHIPSYLNFSIFAFYFVLLYFLYNAESST